MANVENFCGTAMTFKQIHAARIISNIYELLVSEYTEMSRLCTGVQKGTIQVNRAKREFSEIRKDFKRYYRIFLNIEIKHFSRGYVICEKHEFVKQITNAHELYFSYDKLIDIVEF